MSSRGKRVVHQAFGLVVLSRTASGEVDEGNYPRELPRFLDLREKITVPHGDVIQT